MLYKKKKPFSSLRKCRALLHESVARHKKLMHRLSSEQLLEFEGYLEALDTCIKEKNLVAAKAACLELTSFLQTHGKKTIWDHCKEFFFAIIIALCVAGVVRQVWFELYEIPTGSMRPTFREEDRVLAMKNAFGINVPFQTSHLYFNPQSLHRENIVVITGDGLDLADVDTTYFGLFPGKRRYVKRMVAKGGDTIYFYGGTIYGFDKEGRSFELTYPIEHIPFISFEGKVSYDSSRPHVAYIKHMNIAIAKVESVASMFQGSILEGQVVTPNGWQPESFLQNKPYPQCFFQFWGIQNFAMCRLIKASDLPQEAKLLGYEQRSAKLYLELKHSPTLPSKTTQKTSYHNPLFNFRYTWLALDDAHIDAIKENLYTARFFVKNGYVYDYTPEGLNIRNKGFYLSSKVEDGCYEFYNGTAYKIGWGAIAHALDKTHPIYPKSLEALKKLYNAGIEIHRLHPDEKSYFFPARYGYFRNGDFYTLDNKIFDKNDPLLEYFVSLENKRSQTRSQYFAFVDHGQPKKNDTIDKTFIQAYGYTVPENHYLLLGDNHAMSNDSRFFGAVPQQNIEGSPVLLFWPPSPRWGVPTQPPIPFFRVENLIIWTAVGVLGGLSYWIFMRRHSAKTFHKRKKKKS